MKQFLLTMAGVFAGLVLFLITFVVLSISKLLLQRLKRREGRVG